MMLLRSTSIQLLQHSTNAADEKMQSAQGDEHVHQEEPGLCDRMTGLCDRRKSLVCVTG